VTGPTGPTGPIGSTGPTGATGLTGPVGPIIWSFNGAEITENIAVGVNAYSTISETKDIALQSVTVVSEQLCSIVGWWSYRADTVSYIEVQIESEGVPGSLQGDINFYFYEKPESEE
jgi:hypothetical protein